MSLFKDGLIRKPKKATLGNTLLTTKVDTDPNLLHVLMEEHFCTKYNGIQVSLLETFASFMLITSH